MDKLGPFELDNIYPGECSAMMAQLPDECIDFWLTSPPYDAMRKYRGFAFPFEAVARQLWRVTKSGGVGVWVVADETKDGSESGTSFGQALFFKSLGFNLLDTMIFHKGGNGAAGSHYAYWQEFEFMFVFSKDLPATVNLIRDRKNIKSGGANGRQKRGEKAKPEKWVRPEMSARGNVWFYKTGANCGTTDKTEHPAMFPEDLARDHILSWSNPGDLVLDPMVGSGTTAKMAKESGRHWLGFDISPEYVESARKRVSLARVPLFTENPVTLLPNKRLEPTPGFGQLKQPEQTN